MQAKTKNLIKNLTKGQINVEYFVSMVVFIVFVSYIVLELIRFMPYYLVEIDKEILRSETYQLSELLVNDPGSPASWEMHAAPATDLVRLGLSDETQNKTNLLSLKKVTLLETLCGGGGGYERVRSWMDTYDRFSIVIIDSETSNIVVNCQPSGEEPAGRFNTTVRRIVAFDSGGYGELILNLW